MERTTSKAHPEFDLQRAAKAFKNFDKLRGRQIASPYSLYSVETLRDRHRLRKKPALETDIFVWGMGPAKLPHLTKVSGLPYWPTNKAWPTDDEGMSLRFLAQFYLGDSRDLLPALPGDLLSLFVPTADDWQCAPSQIHFEWQTVAPQPIIEQFPRRVTSYALKEWYGVIYRAHDYPKMKVPEHIPGDFDLPILNATKIGGAPHGIQSWPELLMTGGAELPKFLVETSEGEIDATFIAQLTSIQACPNVPFPWTNLEVPYDVGYGGSGIYDERHQCKFGDMGSIFIYLLDDGSLFAEIEDY